MSIAAHMNTGASHADSDVPADQRRFLTLNAELARDWPSISKKRQPLPDAEHWATVTGKLDHLQHP